MSHEVPDGEDEPVINPGDFAICGDCTAVIVFDEETIPHLASEESLVKLAKEFPSIFSNLRNTLRGIVANRVRMN